MGNRLERERPCLDVKTNNRVNTPHGYDAPTGVNNSLLINSNLRHVNTTVNTNRGRHVERTSMNSLRAEADSAIIAITHPEHGNLTTFIDN